MPRPGLGTTQHPTRWVLVVLSPEVKQPGIEYYHSLTFITDARNEWVCRCTSSLPICLHDMHRGNFTFYWKQSHFKNDLHNSQSPTWPPTTTHSVNSMTQKFTCPMVNINSYFRGLESTASISTVISIHIRGLCDNTCQLIRQSPINWMGHKM
jgi:hypothetical protein